MKRGFFLLILINIFVSCTMLKNITKEPVIELDKQQLEKVIHESVETLLKEYWLSDFLVLNNKRPILMTSNITNTTSAKFNIQELYNTIEMDLIESGQVRVVKSNEQQQSIPPTTLSSGKSVDYVLSATFGKKPESEPPILILQLSLWTKNSATPITTVLKEIN